MHFTDIDKLIQNGSVFTRDIFNKRKDEFEQYFNNSETLPDFFKIISKKINRNDKCRFFKDWLETFISSQIFIDRTWYFDLFPKIEPISILTKRNTKKRKK